MDGADEGLRVKTCNRIPAKAMFDMSFFPKGRSSCIFKGDCAQRLGEIPDSSIDLVFTSPPYAEQRKHDYGGIPADKYVEWFLPISLELKRVLKPTGSFVLNIKEGSEDGRKQMYVYDLASALVREQDWLWAEEYIWHKTNPYPGKFRGRFKDAYERLYHFAPTADFKFRQDAVSAQPSKEQYAEYLAGLHKKTRNSATNSKFRTGGYNLRKEGILPSNVVHGAAPVFNMQHSAAFPYWLPEWFVKLLTDKGDVVLDPFLGGGTTMLAALDLGRKAVGIEKDPEYHSLARERIRRRTSGETTRSILRPPASKTDEGGVAKRELFQRRLQ